MSKLFFIILFSGICIDLTSKYVASEFLGEKIHILGDFVYFMYTENTGIAFSIAIPPLFLKIMTSILIIGIFYYYISEVQEKKSLPLNSSDTQPQGISLLIKDQFTLTFKKERKYNTILHISFGLILAGAIGNGIERIFIGYVVDFIGVKYFAVFNLADSFITIGAFFYIYLLYREKQLFSNN